MVTPGSFFGMPILHDALADLVRLGLNGDALSVRQYARRFVRKLPDDDDPSRRLKAEISKLLVTGNGSHTVRRTSGEALRRPVDVDSFSELIRSESRVEAPRPVLSGSESKQLDMLLQERQQAEGLAAAGLQPGTTLLLTGPPGVGKTMTAKFLAGELGLPLHTLDLATVMSSYLGKTGQNIRAVLDFARSEPCVLLLDEFDALAKSRDDPTDVGELKRIVNILLLDLETWPDHGLLIAATNHPELLDRAVWRRFDFVVDLLLPNLGARAEILAMAIASSGMAMPDEDAINVCAAALEGASGADTTRLATRAVKAAVMGDERLEITLANSCLDFLRKQGLDDSEAKSRFCFIGRDVLGLSQRATARLLGTSHVTVGKLLKAI